MPIAVIIDVEGSKRLPPTERGKLLGEIREALGEVYAFMRQQNLARPALTSGDSCELLVNSWKPVAYVAHKLLLGGVRFRAGLGATRIYVLRELVDECDGPAFWKAREALEETRRKTLRPRVAFAWEEDTPELEKAHIALAALYVTYIWGLSKAQLEYTYYYAWRDMTVSQIARETGKTLGAISKTLKKARAHTIKTLLKTT